ncbi:L-threonylcarbamoyladenylate synthase [Candidatus Oleimmundimicrobium sp.]|uniref:L-threonylcarbamoyladenylate synthase n=1 Tax=Candidatus Oleimmundimicrobium sp. TaxID=3060597 RepID=UPI0027237449|nr:L-threonylcarbamoyladenylate synthase [Candidatus Oleimmundimicrobium sp.]MDO8886087.1 L-threonylcarbamoyladenylate synthase [Candidatus Oleimmundimicrobium sp.]
MQAKIIKVDCENPELAVIEEAADILKAGGLVAFPTETVYGLGADTFNPEAVERIFKIKGRPFDKPLAICISNVADLDFLVEEVPEFAKNIIDRFWPGPLTLIFKKRETVFSQATCGRATVGIRFPKNKITLSLIASVGRPLVLTSANISGIPSSIEAQQVLNDIGKNIDLILDGGKTELGVESTILDLTTAPPTIIREGAITVKEIEKVLGKLKVS